MSTDINWDLVDERTCWKSEEKIWTMDGDLIDFDSMNEDEEYVIY